MSERLLIRLVRAAAAAIVRECDAIKREQEIAPAQRPVPVDDLTQAAAKKILRKLAGSR